MSSFLDGWVGTRLTGSETGYGKPFWRWLVSTFVVSLAPAADSMPRWKNAMRRSERPSPQGRRTGTWRGWLACRISGSRRSWISGSVAVLAALLFAATAAASPGKDMAAAMRALHYPKAGALKTGCRQSGSAFRCTATYRHHRVRRFYAGWAATGGWICAGPKPTGCRMLKHGFIPSSQARANGSVQFSAQLASRGYMQIHYNDPQPYVAAGCVQSGKPSTWSFCYKLDTGNVNVTVHMGHVKAGYMTTVSAALY